MSTPINDNFQNLSPKPLDSRAQKFVGGQSVPYDSVADANARINIAYRYEGLTVYVIEGNKKVEYSYQGGVGDANLLYKLPDIERRVKQSGHGFLQYMAVYKDGSNSWQRSNANSVASSCVSGVVTEVLDANNFIVGRQGDIIPGTSGLPISTNFFLDISISGANYTTNPPINTPGKFVKKIFRTNASGEVIIEIDPGLEVMANQFVEHQTVPSYSAATQGSTPTMYEVVSDETNGNAPTLYYWTGNRMFRLSSTLGGTTTTTTAATTTTTTTAGGTTTTTTGGTTTTTTTGANPFDQEILGNLVGQYIPDLYAGVAHIKDPDDTHVQAGNAGLANLKDITNTPTNVSFFLTSPGLGLVAGDSKGNDPNSDTVFNKAGIALQSWLLNDGTGFKFSGLTPNHLYRLHLWCYSYSFDHHVGYFTINGQPTGQIDSAGNSGTSAGNPLQDTALLVIDIASDSAGEINGVAHHNLSLPGTSAGAVFTAFYLGRYSGSTTTTTTSGTTTTTTAATTTTTTTSGGTTTTTTAGTTTTTTTGAPEFIRMNMGNEFQGSGGVPNWNWLAPTNPQLQTPNGVNYTNLIRSDGTTSSVSITNPNAWLAYYQGFGPSPADSGVFPDQIIKYGWRFANGAQLQLGGLTVGASYTLYVAGNAASFESNTQSFTIGGNTSSPDQDTSNNWGDSTAHPDPFTDPALVAVNFTASSANMVLTCNLLSGSQGVVSAMILKKN